MLKVGKSKYKLRYDIWEERRCECCGKLLGKAKVKADLTQWQVEKEIWIL